MSIALTRCVSGHEVLAGDRFCGQCGTALTTKWVSPDSPPQRLLRSLSTKGGERKSLTLLFADIRNSTSLVDSLGDPELATLANFVLVQFGDPASAKITAKDIDAARIRNAVPRLEKVERAQGVNREIGEQEKSGLTVATLISTPNPVSQVLW